MGPGAELNEGDYEVRRSEAAVLQTIPHSEAELALGASPGQSETWIAEDWRHS